MKNRIIALLCCAALLTALCGCQLAQPDAGQEQTGDKLVGVFVTTEYLDLFDMEAWLNDNPRAALSGGEIHISDTSGYHGRLYATEKPAYNSDGELSYVDYVFEGLEGFPLFTFRYQYGEGEYDAILSSSTEGFSDVHLQMGDVTALSGTLYFTPGQYVCFYMNPVYQSADGSVYLTAGSGISTDTDSEGVAMSQTMEETRSVKTTDGLDREESFSLSAEFAARYPTEQAILLQMTEDGSLLCSSTVDPCALPESFTPEPETAYIILEDHRAGPIDRSLLDRECSSFSLFLPRENGICVETSVELRWSETDPAGV